MPLSDLLILLYAAFPFVQFFFSILIIIKVVKSIELDEIQFIYYNNRIRNSDKSVTSQLMQY